MANINDNRIDLVLDEETIELIISSLDEAITRIPDLSLTDEERKSLVSADVDNKIFIDNTLVELDGGARDLVPAFISTENLRNDLLFSEQMQRILSKVAILNRRATDASRVAHSEAMTTCLLTYNIIKAASKAGVAGAKDPATRLGERFDRLGRGEDETN